MFFLEKLKFSIECGIFTSPPPPDTPAANVPLTADSVPPPSQTRRSSAHPGIGSFPHQSVSDPA